MNYNMNSMDLKQFTHKTSDYKLPYLTVEEDDNSRQYKTPDGKKYHSVTTVTGWKKSEFFKRWRQKNPVESARVLRRGNDLHLLIEKYLDNEENFLENVLPNEYILFEQALSALNKIDNVVCQEAALWSDLMELAGRVDCIAEYDGKLSVIDFKGSTRLKRAEDIDNYFMQATAYAIMWQERTGQKIDNIVILMTCEDGNVEVFESKPRLHTKDLFECIKDYKIQRELDLAG